MRGQAACYHNKSWEKGRPHGGYIISFRELVTASLIAPLNTLVVSPSIVREFEQGNVSGGMAMAVSCVLFTTTALVLLNCFIILNKTKKFTALKAIWL